MPAPADESCAGGQGDESQGDEPQGDEPRGDEPMSHYYTSHIGILKYLSREFRVVGVAYAAARPRPAGCGRTSKPEPPLRKSGDAILNSRPS